MYAVEFQTKVQDGLIAVPAEHLEKLKGKVRVILLAEEKEGVSDKPDIIEELLNNPLQIPDFKPMTRDEIYDRRQ